MKMISKCKKEVGYQNPKEEDKEMQKKMIQKCKGLSHQFAKVDDNKVQKKMIGKKKFTFLG